VFYDEDLLCSSAELIVNRNPLG